MSDILLEKIKMGGLELKNKVVMAPLTRQRSTKTRVPNDLMKTYYEQRASAGLIITEATSIVPMGVGYEDTPGIWNDEQTQAWKKITDAIHKKDGKIVLQLWHVGRISHPYFLNGELPVSSSAIKPKGEVSLIRPKMEFVKPRELETREVENLVQRYKEASKRAKEAGFDGVELHAANGYLIDQFIQSSTNKRTDKYGGPLENRARFLLEIVDSISEVWAYERIGVHLSPACDYMDMGDENPKETFGYIAEELGKRKISFIFLREASSENYLTPYLKERFKGAVIANQSLTLKDARELLENKKADAVSWGKYYISNPDLVYKIKNNIEFTEFDMTTFYTKGEEGYTTY